MKKKNVALTLAEVLITLAIIGIVAAMTIPTLVSNYQKKVTVQRLKSTIAIVNQAVRLSIAQNGDISGWDIGGTNNSVKFNTYILPFIVGQKSVTKAGELKYYEPNGTRLTTLSVISASAEKVTLNNGVDLFICGPDVYWVGINDGVLEMGMLVDINGYASGPNRFGHDAFYINITSKRGVFNTYGDDGEHSDVIRTREQLKNGPSAYRYQCNKGGKGLWCGALIQADNWEIRADYPW